MAHEPIDVQSSVAASEQAGSGAIPAARYNNRDLSWLAFNNRVLAQALDESTLVMERLKFLAIYSSNLDEFFMKRVGLMRQRLSQDGEGYVSIDGRSASEILSEISTIVIEQQRVQAECWESGVMPALADAGIAVVRYEELSDREREWLGEWYERNVFPTLTPLAVDPGHRFPFISNLSENFGLWLTGEDVDEPIFARVKIPSALPRFVRIGGTNPDEDGTADGVVRYLLLEDLIEHNLGRLFPGMEILDVMRFRVTRSAAVEREDDDDADDLIELVEDELRRRRFADTVRLEVPEGSSRGLLQHVARELNIGPDAVYERRGLLEYGDLLELRSLPRPDLKEATWTPVVPRALSEEGVDVFTAIRRRDILLHHPYESFEHSVERFIAEAASDPDVLTIKQTLYRTSPDSQFVASLIAAAERGKQVACMVEVRARFDESRNVQFARKLERAGVHVAYGRLGLKTHCKCSLVVRREQDQSGDAVVRCYAHIGTGNYHPKTAQLYTDLGLLTADEELTADVVRLFNTLTGRSSGEVYDKLLVAPAGMRPKFNELIDAEIARAKAGGHAQIIAKMNQLEDRRLIERLYEASNAGVKITCYVRGFCGLRPGVAGLSENIEVVSVLGRFLEHSRVYYFSAGCDANRPEDGVFYIASADWMYRNLNNRVEAAAPVTEESGRLRLWEILEVMRRDGQNAWVLGADGEWSRRELVSADPEGPESIGTFETLMRRTRGQAGSDEQ